MEARYAKITARTTCQACGQPLPLATLSERATCPYCFQDNEISTERWIAVLRQADEHTDRGERAEGSVGLARALIYSVEPGEPRCEKCASPLPASALAGDARNFACPSCGDPASTEPAPAWARTIESVRQIFSADPKDALEGHRALAAEAEAIRPIAMACPRCGGGLEITTKSARLLACRFCQADVYLPDEIWRRLHPIKKVEPFYVRFEGISGWRRETEEAERRTREAEEAQNAARMAAQAEAQREREERIARAAEATRTARVWAGAFTAALGTTTVAAWVTAARGLRFSDSVIVPILIALLVFALVTTAMITRPIGIATDRDFDWVLFVTWFWLPFVLMMPVIGSVMALVRALLLSRGSFGASTITSNGNRKHYDAIDLHGGESRPAALFFLGLGTLYPAGMLAWFNPEIIRSLAGG